MDYRDSLTQLITLLESKDHLIDRLDLTDEQKEEIKGFFKKHPNYENKIDWNNKNLVYDDFKELLASEGTSRNQIKKYGISGKAQIEDLKEGVDYDIVYQDDDCTCYNVKTFKGSEVLAKPTTPPEGVQGKWCIAGRNYSPGTRDQHWQSYTQDRNFYFIFTRTKKYAAYIKKNLFFEAKPKDFNPDQISVSGESTYSNLKGDVTETSKFWYLAGLGENLKPGYFTSTVPYYAPKFSYKKETSSENTVIPETEEKLFNSKYLTIFSQTDNQINWPEEFNKLIKPIMCWNLTPGKIDLSLKEFKSQVEKKMSSPTVPIPPETEFVKYVSRDKYAQAYIGKDLTVYSPCTDETGRYRLYFLPPEYIEINGPKVWKPENCNIYLNCLSYKDGKPIQYSVETLDLSTIAVNFKLNDSPVYINGLGLFKTCPNLKEIIWPGTLTNFCRITEMWQFFSTLKGMPQIAAQLSLNIDGQRYTVQDFVNLKSKFKGIRTEHLVAPITVSGLRTDENGIIYVKGNIPFSITDLTRTKLVFPEWLTSALAFEEVPRGMRNFCSSVMEDWRILKSVLEEVEFKNPRTVLPSRLFKYASNLKRVVLPSQLKVIEYDTFEQCSQLKEINIPSTITKIETNAFSETGIESLDLSHCTKLWRIGYDAFASCKNLKQVILPLPADFPEYRKYLNSHHYIPVFYHPGLFAQCPLLTDITFLGTQEDWKVLSRLAKEWDGQCSILAGSQVRRIHCTDGIIRRSPK